MKITHQDLITISNLLRHDGTSEGLCAGFTGMFGQSVLAGDESSFNDRLHFMAMYKNDFPKLVEEIREAQKKSANSRNDKDAKLLDILVFFDGIKLYLRPDYHKDYFSGQRCVTQSYVKEIFNLTKPVCLEKDEIEVLLSKSYTFTEETLGQFFNDLSSQLNEHSILKTPIYLGASGHSVALSYDSEKGLWKYVDTQDFASFPEEPEYFRLLSTDNLVKSIMNSFGAKSYLIMNTKVVTLNKDSLPLQELRKNLNQLDCNYPIETEHIEYFTNKETSLLYLASRNGNLKDVKTILTHEKALVNQAENQDPLSSSTNTYLNFIKKIIIGQCIERINKPTQGETPFFRACAAGHLEIVKEFLKFEYTDINKPNKDEGTPFFIACQMGHLEVVKKLLKPKYKADINKPNKDGVTPFLMTCRMGHLEIVKELYKPKYKTDTNKRSTSGITPFFIACQQGHLEMVKEFLKPEYIMDTHEPSNTGATPLFIACQEGHLAVVKELLKSECKTDINMPDKNGETPLYIACKKGRLDIVKLLLKPEYKTDVTKPNNQGITPFFVACYMGHWEVVKEFIQSEYQTDINERNNYGVTPFYIACLHGHLEMVKEFLKPEYKTDIHEPHSSGATPLFIACHEGHLEVVKVLLKSECKTDFNMPDKNGETPLFIACKKGRLDIVKELLKSEYKTDFNMPNNQGITPFYIACQNGHLEMVKEFLASPHFKTEMINTVGTLGNTPLLAACLCPHTKNKKELFELLLKHGANMMHRNEANQAAIDIAIAQKNPEVISALIANMALCISKNRRTLFQNNKANQTEKNNEPDKKPKFFS